MSKSYRIRDEEAEELKETRLKMIVESKTDTKESDILHVLIRKNLKNISIKEVLKYREEVLKKDD
jgi:hypothetical protein